MLLRVLTKFMENVSAQVSTTSKWRNTLRFLCLNCWYYKFENGTFDPKCSGDGEIFHHYCLGCYRPRPGIISCWNSTECQQRNLDSVKSRSNFYF